MKRVLFAASLLLSTVPAWAQTATGVGVGTSVANSKSQSQAVAIGGGNAQGGNSASTLTVNGAATPSVTSSTTTVQGTQTLRNVPTVFAPGLASAGLETCLGSVSGGVGWVGFGVSGGGSIQDERCAARLDARTLWSMGLKKAAVARLCLTPEIYRSMPEVCVQYLPQPAGVAYASTTETPDYAGGPVEVVMQKTGAHRICNDYDVTQRRCRAWARGH